MIFTSSQISSQHLGRELGTSYMPQYCCTKKVEKYLALYIYFLCPEVDLCLLIKNHKEELRQFLPQNKVVILARFPQISGGSYYVTLLGYIEGRPFRMQCCSTWHGIQASLCFIIQVTFKVWSPEHHSHLIFWCPV